MWSAFDVEVPMKGGCGGSESDRQASSVLITEATSFGLSSELFK